MKSQGKNLKDRFPLGELPPGSNLWPTLSFRKLDVENDVVIHPMTKLKHDQIPCLFKRNSRNSCYFFFVDEFFPFFGSCYLGNFIVL